MLLDILPNHISPYIIVREFHIGIILCLSQYTENLVHRNMKHISLSLKNSQSRGLGFFVFVSFIKILLQKEQEILSGYKQVWWLSLCNLLIRFQEPMKKKNPSIIKSLDLGLEGDSLLTDQSISTVAFFFQSFSQLPKSRF